MLDHAASLILIVAALVGTPALIGVQLWRDR